MTVYREFDAIIGAGQFLWNKFCVQARESGVQRAAANLRKQGCDLRTVLLMVRALPRG
jgi:hypothetical protein